VQYLSILRAREKKKTSQSGRKNALERWQSG
jgi:hypothetical protein